MSVNRVDLPTLTEVVDLTANKGKGGASTRAAAPAYEPLLPVQDEAVALDADAASALLQASARAAAPPQAYDEELLAQVMVRLQPRLEAWVEAHVRQAMVDLLPVWTESAALTMVRDLRSELPELLSVALDEVQRRRSQQPSAQRDETPRR